MQEYIREHWSGGHTKVEVVEWGDEWSQIRIGDEVMRWPTRNIYHLTKSPAAPSGLRPESGDRDAGGEGSGGG